MLSFINFKTISLSLVLLVSLSACRLGKEYQRPKLNLPEHFTKIANADTTTSVADIEWRSFFTDTTLQALIQKGITYNNDMLLAVKRIEIAQQNLKQARLLQIPEADFQVSATYNHPSLNSLSGLSANGFLGRNHIEDYNAAINLSWEADIWGKLRWQKEAALSDYLQTKDAINAVQTRLVSDIAQGYFNLLMLDKQLQVAQQNLALSDSFLVATRLLKDAGTVNLLAVQQADAQRQTTALLVPQLEEGIALQENTLQLLTGQLPGELNRSTTLSDYKVREEMATGLPLSVISRRPDVRATELALVAANARVGVALTSMYPTLKIGGSFGLESFQASNWFSIPNALFGLIGGNLIQPVFHHRQLKTQFEVSKLQREQAVIQFRYSVLVATTEVANALIREEKLQQQQTIATAQTDTLKEAVVNAQLLFKSDLANYLEVITAQSNALNAELNLATIQRNRLGAMVELYRALGGGWK